MKTEKSIMLSPLQLAKINKLPDSFEIAYIGSDSCEHLMPSPSDVSFILSTRKKPVISLPILTDCFLSKACELIDKSLLLQEKIEVSANDIGTLVCLKENFGSNVILSAGKYLFSLMEKNSLSFVDDIRDEFDISFFECDDPHTASSFLRARKYNIAFHYPFRFYSITRICPYRGDIFKECDRPCGGKNIPLDGGKIIWNGNAFFTKSSKMPEIAPQRIILSSRI